MPLLGAGHGGCLALLWLVFFLRGSLSMGMPGSLDLGGLSAEALPDGPLHALGDAWVAWGPVASFGPWLKGLRVQARLSLRDAAAAVSLSHTLLMRLERNETVKPPSAQLLAQLARLYAQPVGEMLFAAGYRTPDVSPPAPAVPALVSTADLRSVISEAVPALAGCRFDVFVVLDRTDLDRLRAEARSLTALPPEVPNEP